MATAPSVQRQDRLTGKLVQEIARQLSAREPHVAVSTAEEEYIATEVRRHIFKGNPLGAADVGQILSTILGRRAAARVAELPPRPASNAVVAGPSDSRDSVRSSLLPMSEAGRRSVTPSVRSVTSRRAESVCGSEASVAHSTASTASRLSVIRDRDRRALEALAQLCAVAPPQKEASAPRNRLPPVVPPVDPQQEAEISAKAAAAARAHLAKQQEEIRKALEEQIKLKKLKAVAETEEERRERDLRVASASESLGADAAKIHEERKRRELERKQNASVLAESVSRKRSAQMKEIQAERSSAVVEVVDHEVKLRQEREERRKAVERLRHELLSEAEKKVQAKKKSEVEQLEYEIKLLEQMNEKIELERQNQEAQRQARILAAKATQEACRAMVEEAKKRELAEKSSQDQVTINGDKQFIEKERAEAARRRQQNRETQQYLHQQILDRQLRQVLQKSDDDPYVNKERIEEIEAKHREREELEIKREAQRQWRAFLDMQQKAKMAMKSVSDVAVSITRPASTTPWF